MAERCGINLEKGESAQVGGGIERLLVGCGWEPQVQRSSFAFDLDVACVLLNGEGRMPSARHFVYYGNLRFGDGDAVVHTGDNLTGEGDGDDERLLLDLARLPAEVTRIDIFVAIYKARERGQMFGMISDAYLRCVDVTGERNTSKTGPLYQAASFPQAEFCRFRVNDEAATSDCVLFGALERVGARGWRFRAIQKEVYGGFDAVLASVAPLGESQTLALRPQGEMLALVQAQAGTLGAHLRAICVENKLALVFCGLAYMVLNVGLLPLCLVGAASVLLMGRWRPPDQQ